MRIAIMLKPWANAMAFWYSIELVGGALWGFPEVIIFLISRTRLACRRFGFRMGHVEIIHVGARCGMVRKACVEKIDTRTRFVESAG